MIRLEWWKGSQKDRQMERGQRWNHHFPDSLMMSILRREKEVVRRDQNRHVTVIGNGKDEFLTFRDFSDFRDFSNSREFPRFLGTLRFWTLFQKKNKLSPFDFLITINWKVPISFDTQEPFLHISDTLRPTGEKLNPKVGSRKSLEEDSVQNRSISFGFKFLQDFINVIVQVTWSRQHVDKVKYQEGSNGCFFMIILNVHIDDMNRCIVCRWSVCQLCKMRETR